jgi:hypothetical protein
MRAASLLFGVAILSTAAAAHATADMCVPHAGDGVVINHCANHGYGDAAIENELPAQVQALGALRRRLVASGRLDDRPVLFERVSFIDTTHLSRETACVRSSGEGDVDPDEAPVGDCYRVVSSTESFAIRRGLLLALAGVKDGQPQEVADVATWSRRGRALGGARAVLPAIPSPDGRRAVVPTWTERGFRFAVVDRVAGTSRALAGLPRRVLAMPLWTPDGTRFALADAGAVVLVSPSGEVTRVPLTPGSEGIGKVTLAFDADGQQLVATQASETFAEPASVAIDLADGDAVHPTPIDSLDLWWSGDASGHACRIAAESAALEALR